VRDKVVVLSVPVKAGFPWHLLSNTYDWREYRLDYNLEFVLPEDVVRVDEKTIITVREKAEGGIYQISPEHKISIYRDYVKKYNCLVDCELSFWETHKPPIPYENLIISCHINAENPEGYYGNAQDSCLAIIDEIIERVNKVTVRFLKIVVPIESYLEMEKIKEAVKESKNEIIVMGTGSLGKLSRILYRYLGSKGIFAGLPGYTTSNSQLDTSELQQWEPEKINSQTIFGGIIGKTAVYHSLGHQFYNSLFKKSHIHAVYLPLATNCLQDLINWLESFVQNHKLYGFSVTMPYKSEISSLLANVRKPVNLISPVIGKRSSLQNIKEDHLLNTDLAAFTKALRFLGINRENRIVVFGTGDTAETLLSLLGDFPKTLIIGRNQTRGNHLSRRYDKPFLTLSEVKSGETVDLLVNCTSIGMNGENLFEAIPELACKCLIDLPYRKLEQDTPAVANFKAKHLPYVCGKTFWSWQAIEQEKAFMVNIRKILNS
jgi:3-dehydroquinate dehydratase type I